MKNPNKINLDVENVTSSEWDDIGDYFVKKDEIDIDSIHDEKGNITINHWNEVHADGELRDKLHEYWGSEGVKEIQDELRQEQEEADKLSAQLQGIYDAVENGKGRIEKYPEINSSGDPTGFEIERFVDDKGRVQNLNVLKRRQSEQLDWVKHHENELIQGENDAVFGLMRDVAIEGAERESEKIFEDAKDIFEQITGVKDGEISAKFNIVNIYSGSKFKMDPSQEFKRENIKDIFDKLDKANAEKARAERLRNGEDYQEDDSVSTFEKELDKIESELYHKEKMKEVDSQIEKANEFFKEYAQEGENFEDISRRMNDEHSRIYDQIREVEKEYRNPGFFQRIKNIFPPARRKFNLKYESQLDDLRYKSKNASWATRIFGQAARAEEFKGKGLDGRMKIALEEGRQYKHMREKVQPLADEYLLGMLKDQF